MIHGTVVISDDALPVALKPDSLLPYVCNVTLPQLDADTVLTLSVTLDTVPPDATIFGWSAGIGTAQPSSLGKSTITSPITSSGVYGVTHTPGNYQIAGSVGTDPPASQTIPDVLRNLEGTNAFTAAFFDGTHLLVGNGRRVLIYQGFPKLNDRPSVVLGQPGFDATSLSDPSASSFGSRGAGGIWSDGKRVVISNGNRVLIWQNFPTADFTPADIVLGQADFASNNPNAGGQVGPGTMFNASSVDRTARDC